MKKEFFKPLLSLSHLWPAALTLALIIVTLPGSRPVLAALPEKLEAEQTSVQTDKSEEQELEEVLEGDYEDGTYTGSAQGYGGLVSVEVVVKDGRIVSVEILSASGETTSFFNRAMGVVEEVIAKQTWQVDVVSGATYSSNGILGAIQNALTGEQVNNEAPATSSTSPVTSISNEVYEAPANGYQDGTYVGSATGFGGAIQVEVTVSNGVLSNIQVLSASYETKSFFNMATAVIERALNAGSPNVDTVSGATYSSTGILNAVKRALNQAAIGDMPDLDEVILPDLDDEADEDEMTQPSDSEQKPEQESPEQKPSQNPDADENQKEEDKTDEESPLYKDGTYTTLVRCSDEDFFDYSLQVQITIEEGKIIKIAVEKQSDLSDDPETNDTYLNYAMQGRTRKNKWYEGVISQLLNKQSSAQIDAVSGATYSSKAIAEGFEQALSQAKTEVSQ